MPFEGFEEALWALRVTREDSAVDLFGLGIPSIGSREQHAYKQGELKYVLRGSGTHLFRTIERAQQWWDRLRGEATGDRRTGSGIWDSRIDFFIALRKAVRTLRVPGRKVTQENVADFLGCDVRVLRRWLGQHNIPWEDVLKIT